MLKMYVSILTTLFIFSFAACNKQEPMGREEHHRAAGVKIIEILTAAT